MGQQCRAFWLSARICQFGFHRTDFRGTLRMDFYENLLIMFRFDYNLTKLLGILHEALRVFMTTLIRVFLHLPLYPSLYIHTYSVVPDPARYLTLLKR